MSDEWRQLAGYSFWRETGTNDVRLALQFDTAEPVHIALSQAELLQLIASAHAQIERGPLTPTSLDRLRPGAPIQVSGFQATAKPDGTLRLVLLAELGDRVVTVPFELPPEAVADLKKAMGG